MQDKIIQSAYESCLELARRHYENFPTATRIIAKQHRNATAAIYSFARRADDIADEGTMPDEQRLVELDRFAARLKQAKQGDQLEDPTFIALADTIRQYQLPLLPFEKLLTAFKMDVNKKRFETFSELLFYCDHSANPVGELILRLHKIHSPATQILSDHICTALQLINFLQDIHEDYSLRDRIYIPKDEMEKFAVTEDNIRSKANSDNLSQLVNFQLIRAMDMLLAGVPLIAYLHGRLKWVIKLTIMSALCVCEKLSRREDVFTRPVLNRAEWLNILLRTLYFRPDMTRAKIKNNMTIRTSL